MGLSSMTTSCGSWPCLRLPAESLTIAHSRTINALFYEFATGSHDSLKEARELRGLPFDIA